jgi:predicted MFS family arabinose efflux permease
MTIAAGSFVPLMTKFMHTGSAQDKLHRATFAMVAQGVGEVVGALGNGKMQDILGTKRNIFLNLVEVVVAFSALIWFTLNGEFNEFSACIMTFFWGVQDAGVGNFICCVCGFQFENKIQAFSILYFIQSFFKFAFLELQAVLDS